MGHNINALIGTHRALENIVSQFGSPAPTELSFGLIIVPLDEQRLDAIAMSDELAIEGFTYLTPRMAQIFATDLSGPSLYIETDYHGGTGGQSAAYFENGRLAWWGAESTQKAPAGSSLAESHAAAANRDKSPISEGLSRIGVARVGAYDEFAQIGLVRFRSLADLGIKYGD